MRIQLTVPGEPNAQTLGIALEAATGLAQSEIAAGNIPPIEDAIHSGIRWQEEPKGQEFESFDKPSTVLARGHGDCDDLAPWLAGEMRETGLDAGATAIAVPSGYKRWHAIVRGSDGMIYDPSEWAGMRSGISGSGVGACACCRPLNPGKVGIQIGTDRVRVDVPGLQVSRGCPLGVAHISGLDVNQYDPDVARVVALVETIEDAIATAQLARTGDKRAIKQLAVIYRVLRGDDLASACNGVGLRQDRVGLDFSSSAVRSWIQKARELLATVADELFNGETWTTHGDRVVKARKVAMAGHRIGFVPCLAALGELGAVAATAGTLAAVVGPIALALSKMVGEDTDFGHAMHDLMQVTDKVSIVSAVGAGIEGLIADGIPAAWTEGVSRWAELLNSPLSAAGFSGNTTQNVANTLHWVEKEGSIALPHDISTRIAPKVLELVAQSQKDFDLLKDGPKKAAEDMKKALDYVKDETKKWLQSIKDQPGAFPPNTDIDKFAEAKATEFFNALIAAPPPPIAASDNPGIHAPRHVVTPDPGIHAPRTVSQATPGQSLANDIAKAAAAELSPVLTEEIDAAVQAREALRTVPIVNPAPVGWDPIFAMGCLQMTGQCK